MLKKKCQTSKLSFLKNYLIRRWKKAKFYFNNYFKLINVFSCKIINNILIKYFLISNDRFKIISNIFIFICTGKTFIQ